MIAAVILAAGESRRLGRPKQLVMLDGETLLERTIRIARETACNPVIVVLGAGHNEILARNQFTHAIPVINDQWSEGMASSIRLGVRTLGTIVQSAAGTILMTCDQPAVTAAHLRALTESGELTASEYAGRRGVPAYFPAAAFPELMSLQGNAGAQKLLHTSATVHLEHGELDIDTDADLDTAKRLLTRSIDSIEA